MILGEDSDTFGASLNWRGLMVLLAIAMMVGAVSLWAVTAFELRGINAMLVGVLPMFLLMPVVYIVIHAFLRKTS